MTVSILRVTYLYHYELVDIYIIVWVTIWHYHYLFHCSKYSIPSHFGKVTSEWKSLVVTLLARQSRSTAPTGIHINIMNAVIWCTEKDEEPFLRHFWWGPQSNHEKTPDRPESSGMQQYDQYSLGGVQVTKDKERLRNCYKVQETRQK